MEGNLAGFARRVAVLSGGDSAERDVSLASGQQVALALSQAGYEPVLIDPAETSFAKIDWQALDVCFLALHGGAGEDGRIQHEFDQLGMPYTGSGPEASRLAMNKSAAKWKFMQAGVPTLPFVALHSKDFNRRDLTAVELGALEEQLAPLDFPMVVKPNGQGSSLGVNIAASPADLPRCLTMAAKFDNTILIEPYIAGREFTVSVLGRSLLPIIEIVSPQKIFTYQAKYSSLETECRLKCDLPIHVQNQISDVAARAADALGTAGLVRVDLILERNQHPWVLEVNTIPGMTARSLSPQTARAAGLEMPALVDWMVRDALDRSARRKSADAAATGNGRPDPLTWPSNTWGDSANSFVPTARF